MQQLAAPAAALLDPAVHDVYWAAPEQSLWATMWVLMRKHLVLGWRRKRFFGIVFRTGVIVLTPLLIWSAQGPDGSEQMRQTINMSVLPLLGVLLMLLVFTQFVIEIVTDKELKMRYVQQVAGVSNTSYWVSYYLYYLILSSFCVALYLTCVVAIAPFYKYSSPLLLIISLTAAFLQIFFLSMMVSTVFGRARMAAVICGMLGSLIVVFSQAFLPMISTTSLSVYFLESLIPFVSPLNLLKAIGVLEGTCLDGCARPGEHPPGFTFDSWSQPVSGRDITTNKDRVQPPAGTQLLILVADCVIYALFALWFDQVYQGEFGSALPWNFCVRPAFMCPKRRTEISTDAGESPPALELVDLVKTFGTHRAVDGMSLEVRRGEIFALLGHNGAGKTTAINCITGMLPATSGEVRVCGVDVATDLRESRRHLSVCPQDNPLYLEYSVDEHLSFFAALRGVPTAQAKQEIDSALSALGLVEKRSARVQTLSGGQKRRLWVATSILGATPVVFLDEPTSGMDPANRRKLWELLVDMKNRGRTILFTTHYLDEADVLAQRKAVLDKGRVLAVGASWDLKRQFGVGYHLRVIGTPSATADLQESLLALLRSHVPEAVPESDPREQRVPRQGAPRQYFFVLPFNQFEKFGHTFKELESRAAELGVADYVVETTSLEEVFMALGQGHGDVAAPEGVQVAVTVPESFDPTRPVEITVPQTGATVAVMLPAGAQPGQTVTVTAPASAGPAFSLASPSSREPVTWSAAVVAVMSLRWRQVLQKQRSLLATFLIPLILMGLNAYSTVSTLNSLVSREGSGDDDDRGSAQQGVALAGAGIGMTMTVALAIALPYFATALVVDRVQRCTYVATSQGLPLSAFWVGTLLSNYLHFLVLSLVVPILLLGFQAPYYGKPAQLASMSPAILLAPVPMLLFAYASSRLFGSAEACSKFMPGISLLASVLPYLAVYIMTILSVVSQMNGQMCMIHDPEDPHCKSTLDFGKTMHTWANNIHWIMSFVDPFYLLPGTFLALGLTSIGNGMEAIISIDVQFPSLAGSAVAVPLVGALVLSAMLAASLALDMDRVWRSLSPPWKRGARRAGTLLRGGESELGPAPTADAQAPAEPALQRSFSVGDADSGVLGEENRVATADPSSQAVLYRGLVHTYNRGMRSEVRAVRGISLAVPRGECFTLLGPNGAGKTTTLDALTGAIFPTEGEVSINGHSVTEGPVSRQKALSSLGNCPQVDPLWPSLSGRQHLLFYAKMKGLPARMQAEQADTLLRALGFSTFDANKPTQGYSGGMKRKLSLAIALIGSPPTLLLDEPSAAVDAAAKRHLWQVVRQREPTQTVILTTHSMEEAEALSDRLAIQVCGKLRCVGTPDYIKNTYGAGYQLELLMGTGSSTARADVEKFVADISPTSELLEQHEGRYLFQLPVLKAVGAGPGELSVAELFLQMQQARSKLGLEDYSISRPSLEQVFLRFSREQEAQGAPEV